MIKVSMAIQSHLSDALYEMSFNLPGCNHRANHRIRFVKYLVDMFPDTNTEVDIHEVYEQFKAEQETIA